MRALLAIVTTGLLLGVAFGAEAPQPRTLTLTDAISVAGESNPAIQAARIDVAAAESARRGAGAPLRNPEVSVGAGARLTPQGTSADVEVGLQIPVDLGGTARHRRARESAALEQARARLRAAELEVTVATRIAFTEAVAAERRLDLAEQAVELGLEMERTARRRHELGEVSVLEPNSAALDRAGAEARRAGARGELAEAMQRLRAVLGVPAGESLTLAESASPAWPSEFPTDEGLLLSRAVAARSDLAAAQEAERAAAADLRAARATGLPDLTLGAGWEREGDEANIVGGGVAFEIPLQRNQIDVARAQRGASRAALEAGSLTLQVERDLSAALAAWHAAAEQHRVTTGEALTLAEANLRLVLRAYETGEEELLVVQMMQRQALTARGAAIDAELALHRQSARLEWAMGEVLF